MAQGVKTGGRQSGTPNKLTSELRTLLKGLLDKEIEALPERLEKLEIKERLEIMVRLLPFVLPKMTQMELTAGKNQNMKYEITFNLDNDKNQP